MLYGLVRTAHDRFVNTHEIMIPQGEQRNSMFILNSRDFHSRGYANQCAACRQIIYDLNCIEMKQPKYLNSK